jgi:hypothetical protein
MQPRAAQTHLTCLRDDVNAALDHVVAVLDDVNAALDCIESSLINILSSPPAPLPMPLVGCCSWVAVRGLLSWVAVYLGRDFIGNGNP